MGSRSGDMKPMHIVWDWNGTLLADLPIIIDAANVGLARHGVPPIDEDGYRNHFQRPVRAFYDSLFDRTVTDHEWETLNDTFHDEYFDRVDLADLADDTLEALDSVDSLGWSQSLLSMSSQHWLDSIVEGRGLAHRFSLIDGLKGATGGLKATHMESHLRVLDLDPRSTVVVGDTPDDAIAASHVGAHSILYDGGSHHLPTLENVGVPIASSLMEAVEIARGL